MMYFARWKTAAILLICLLGVLVSLPNLLPRSAFPSWAPIRQISLGLDLRGGSYLLLEVDTSVLLRERLEGLVEATRRGMTQANPRIAYTGLAAQLDQRRMSLRVTDAAQRDAAVRIVRELGNPVSVGGGAQAPDIDVAIAPDGLLTATVTEAGIRAKATGAVEQSIEIVRRRIDETGVSEALIARQGQNRILVQLARRRGSRPHQGPAGPHRPHDLPPARRDRQRPGADAPAGRALPPRRADRRALCRPPPRRGRWRQPDRRPRQPGHALRRMGGQLHLRQRRHPPLQRDHPRRMSAGPSPSCWTTRSSPRRTSASPSPAAAARSAATSRSARPMTSRCCCAPAPCPRR
jgi:hypothetical protein